MNKKKILSIAIVIIIVIAIIVSILVYTLVFKKKSIDLESYIQVKYTGFNGYATATVDIDDELKNYLGDESLYYNFINELEIDVQNNRKLANGDTLEIKLVISSNFMDNNKLELNSDVIEITVEGLEDADVIDVFDDEEFEVEVNGISPNLSVSVNNNSTDNFIRNYVTYSINESSGLSNGDTIQITANYDEDIAYENGIAIEEDILEYTIEGMPEYVDEVDDLNDSMLNTIENESIDYINAAITSKGAFYIVSFGGYTTSGHNYTSTTPELVEEYLLIGKSSANYLEYNNMVCGIYKVIFTSEQSGKTYEFYFVATTRNISTNDDELYNEDELNISCQTSSRWLDCWATKDEAYESKINSQKDNYIIETIK